MKTSTYQLNSVTTFDGTTDTVTLATFEHVNEADRYALVNRLFTLADTVTAALDPEILRESLDSINQHFFGGNIPDSVVDATAHGISSNPYTALNRLDVDAPEIEAYTVERPFRAGSEYATQARITREYKVMGKAGYRTVGIRVELVYTNGSHDFFDLRAPKGVINPRTFGATAAFKLFSPYVCTWAEDIARRLHTSFDGSRARCRMEFVPVATGEAIAKA